MARIDLIDVCKTFSDRSRAGLEPAARAAGPDSVPGPRDVGRGAPFAIQKLSLRIPDGKTMVVLGPSGCGKTTLLKLIAGLIPPDSGEVLYDDVNVTDVPPGGRRLGMVFQNYALYPHFSARTNVMSYFLFRKRTPELDALAKVKYQRTSELMGVELAYLLDRKPTTLSGGEKQRVALGRCITRDATLFLVDEPFANLDQALREKYRVNLKILLRQFSITTVYVTHDHHEALILADLVAVMDRGRIEQVGTPQEIYDRPKNAFVAGFLNLHTGSPPISLVDARQVPGGERLGKAWIGVRPEHVALSREPGDDRLRGTVASTLSLPPMTMLLTIRVGEQEVHARTASDEGWRAGDQVWLTFKQFHVFDTISGLRLRSYPEIL